MTPVSSRSILRRPTPLPLSPSSPFPMAASFSVVVSPSTNKLSPHVHFPASPAMVATFSALSPNTYDRAPMPVSPSAADHSPWASRVISPSINHSFKLSNPPKRSVAKADTLAVPTPFEDPRSPKPYKARDSSAPKDSAIIVTTPGGPRNNNNLAPPSPFQDPRSPKPYRPLSGVRFEELVLHVPRGNVGVEDLGKALTVYPRSPYPSAPIASEEDDSDMSDLFSPRGRSNARPPRLEKPTHTRARSLDVKPKRRTPAGLGSSTKPGEFLSPVKESPGVTSANALSSKPAPLDLESESRLNNDFWQAVTLEAETPASAVGKGFNGFQSPKGIMFGNQDGTLWSPRPRKKETRGLADMSSMLSPAQRNAFRKETVASPSPHDPFAAFPSFTIAIMNSGSPIPYPPRARVEQ